MLGPIVGEIEGPYDSFGNGSAMRVSPIGWYHNRDNRQYGGGEVGRAGGD